MRSATAPETIVVAVPQNIIWKKKKAPDQGVSPPSNRKPLVPIRPAQLAPNISAKPISQKLKAAIRKSTRFLMTTLMLFLARTRPPSRHAKPACIRKTRMAATLSHSTSMY